MSNPFNELYPMVTCDCMISWDKEDFSMSHDKNRVGTLLSCFIVALRHTAKIFAESDLSYFHCGGVVH
jgi:hypothetical protein